MQLELKFHNVWVERGEVLTFPFDTSERIIMHGTEERCPLHITYNIIDETK